MIEHQISNTRNTPQTTLNLRMMNTRCLTEEKLKLHKALENIMDIKPDIYIFTESKNPPKETEVNHRIIFNSYSTPGQGGTTIIINKGVDIIYTETNIPDTVILVLQKFNSTSIIVGTYISHRIGSRPQALKFILEYIKPLARRYNDPNILIFGDFNLKPDVIHKVIYEQTDTAALLKLQISENYKSPQGFPHLMTRKGTNNKRETIYSRLDYILLNREHRITTEYNPIISDHIIFNLEMHLSKTTIQKKLTTDRNKIYRELKLLSHPNMQMILEYIKTNLDSFSQHKAVKPKDCEILSFRTGPDIQIYYQ